MISSRFTLSIPVLLSVTVRYFWFGVYCISSESMRSDKVFILGFKDGVSVGETNGTEFAPILINCCSNCATRLSILRRRSSSKFLSSLVTSIESAVLETPSAMLEISITDSVLGRVSVGVSVMGVGGEACLRKGGGCVDLFFSWVSKMRGISDTDTSRGEANLSGGRRTRRLFDRGKFKDEVTEVKDSDRERLHVFVSSVSSSGIVLSSLDVAKASKSTSPLLFSSCWHLRDEQATRFSHPPPVLSATEESNISGSFCVESLHSAVLVMSVASLSGISSSLTRMFPPS
mmetsp:Transcript_61070/g.90574  ORF Transcript_61070/g.90574 Transcript_61070/m.90574 type:complete len:288 (+) Transcript_61070:202-1065(+)